MAARTCGGTLPSSPRSLYAQRHCLQRPSLVCLRRPDRRIAARARNGATTWATALPVADLQALAPTVRVGDAVFIHIAFRPFEEVALVTESWTNHVGIVVDVAGPEPVIAESAFPLSRMTPLSRFVERSGDRRFAVTRLNEALTPEEQTAVEASARRRLGVRYDTGFDLHSRAQFCSRFVREVLQEGAGRSVGHVETFAMFLSRHPDAHLTFWKIWYFGHIPWARETVTPASVLRSPLIHLVFDGKARTDRDVVLTHSSIDAD